MALIHGIKSIHQGAGNNIPHVLGYATARTLANDTLFEVWNAATNAGIKAAIDLNGKFYSAALTAGDILYAVAGGVANVKRLDSLAVGTANQILMVNAGATAPQWTSTLTGLTLSNPTLSGTVSGTPTWASSQAITLSTAAQPNITSLGTLTQLTVSGGAIVVTRTNSQQSWNYDGSNSLTLLVDGSGGCTFTAVGASASFALSHSLTVTATSGNQLALQYDGSNAMTIVVANDGAVTIDAAGAGAAFQFNKNVTFNSAAAFNGNVQLGSATMVGSPTWNNTQTFPAAVISGNLTVLAGVVSAGAADSGGAGFKLLRIPN